MERVRVFILAGLAMTAAGCFNAEKMELTSLDGTPGSTSSTSTPEARYAGRMFYQASDGGDVSTSPTASFKMARVSLGADIDKQYGGATAGYKLTGSFHAGP